MSIFQRFSCSLPNIDINFPNKENKKYYHFSQRVQVMSCLNLQEFFTSLIWIKLNPKTEKRLFWSKILLGLQWLWGFKVTKITMMGAEHLHLIALRNLRQIVSNSLPNLNQENDSKNSIFEIIREIIRIRKATSGNKKYI